VITYHLRRAWTQSAAKCPALRQLKHRVGETTAGAIPWGGALTGTCSASWGGGDGLAEAALQRPLEPAPRAWDSPAATSHSPLLFAGPSAMLQELSERAAEDMRGWTATGTDGAQLEPKTCEARQLSTLPLKYFAGQGKVR
jgi:hypothetical protein